MGKPVDGPIEKWALNLIYSRRNAIHPTQQQEETKSVDGESFRYTYVLEIEQRGET